MMERWKGKSEWWPPLADIPRCKEHATLNTNGSGGGSGFMCYAENSPDNPALDKTNSRVITPEGNCSTGANAGPMTVNIDALDQGVTTPLTNNQTNVSDSSSACGSSDVSDTFASDSEYEDANGNFANFTITSSREEGGDSDYEYDDDDFEDDESFCTVMSQKDLSMIFTRRRGKNQNNIDMANNADGDPDEGAAEAGSTEGEDEGEGEGEEGEAMDEELEPPPPKPDISNKLSIIQCRLQGRKVLIRVDFNVPMKDGEITDTTKIDASLPTIKYALDQGAKAVILMSHLGRPGGTVKPELSLKPVAAVLEERLERPVTFLNDCVGANVEKACADAEEGSVILLENLRFHIQEEGKSIDAEGNEVELPEEEMQAFQESLSKLGDLYVNDAFATAHREHSSIVGISLEQRAMGFLLKKELDRFQMMLEKPAKPYLAILGGPNVSDKVQLIESLLDSVNYLIIAGGMALTFLKVINGMDIGKSPYEEEVEEIIPTLMEKAAAKNVRVILPSDFIVADGFDEDANYDVATVDSGIPEDMMGVDVGEESRQAFTDMINISRMIVWYGPPGVFEVEECAEGSKALVEAVVQATERGAITVLGGGDTAACAKHFEADAKVTHVSTGYVASLEFLEGKVLPGFVALSESNSKKKELNKLGLEQATLANLRVFLRVDLDVPVDEEGLVTDNKKIEAVVPTINQILSKGAKSVIILSHRGDPGGEPNPELSMEPVANELETLLSRPVTFIPDFTSEEAAETFADAYPGTVFMLENLKFFLEEEGFGTFLNEEEEEVEIGPEHIEAFMEKLNSLGDAYVNEDMTNLTQEWNSIANVTATPKAAGLMLDKELQFFREALVAPARPLLVIMGGQATPAAFQYLDGMLEYVDQVIIGGALAFTFLKAQAAKIGSSPVDEALLERVPVLMAKANENHVKIHLPVDFVAAANATDDPAGEKTDDETAAEPEQEEAEESAEPAEPTEPPKLPELPSTSLADGIPDGLMGVDIGDESRRKFADIISKAGTIIWHGPMGVYQIESYSVGTVGVMDAIIEATSRGVKAIVAGEGVAAVCQALGTTQQIQHFAPAQSLYFLTNWHLPGVAVLDPNPGIMPGWRKRRRRRRRKKKKKQKAESPPKREGPLPGEPGWVYIPPYTKALPPVVVWEKPKPLIKYEGAPPPGQSKPIKVSFKLREWSAPPPPPTPPAKKPLVPRLADLGLPKPAVPPPPCPTDIAYSQKHKIGQAGRPGSQYVVHHLPPIPFIPPPPPRPKPPRPPVQLETQAKFDVSGNLIIHVNGDQRNVPEGVQVKMPPEAEVLKEFVVHPKSRVHFFQRIQRKKPSSISSQK